MTADDMIENGREAALLARYRRASPRRQRIMARALCRYDDGVPFEECLVDAEIECGTPPAEAREIVRQALAAPADAGDWRDVLI
jgi:hypothetical protein